MYSKSIDHLDLLSFQSQLSQDFSYGYNRWKSIEVTINVAVSMMCMIELGYCGQQI